MEEDQLTRKEAIHLSRWLAFGFSMMAIGLLSSCGTYKSSSSHQSSTEVSDIRHKSDTSSVSVISNKTEIGEETEETETVRIEYDTTKPVDKETGKPPVASETIIKKKKHNNTKKNENAVVEEKSGVSETDELVIKSEVKEDSKKEAKTSSGFMYSILFIVGAYLFFVFYPKICLLFKK
ncbi:MAG: hypothetical protein GY755_13505 [Chloroflexi bacterium]|nr:hypothetical protein [Chloroflexota bacterium]